MRTNIDMMQMNAFGDVKNAKKSKKKVEVQDTSTNITEMKRGASHSDTRPVFGIDLGTTNSAISVCKTGNAPVTAKLLNEKFTMPSCVMWKHGEFIVGAEAYERRDLPNVIYSVKRLMQDSNAVVTLADGNDTGVFTPAEISAEILKGLVKETSGFFGEVKDVVVTVPAYFNQIGRDNTREACLLAGLNPIAVVNEPTASSLCYDLDASDALTKDVIVYDLGGGTFDVTIEQITAAVDGSDEDDDIYDLDLATVKSDKTITVHAVGGDAQLGGDDIDLKLREIILRKLKAAGVNVDNFTDAYMERLLLRAENIKKSDTGSESFTFGISAIGKDGREMKGSITLDSSDVQEAVKFVYDKTKKILKQVMRSVPTTADTIVLVGGSTKNYYLQQLLVQDFPDMKINNALDPDLSVSNGAALFGKVVKFGDANCKVFDIIPLTIGILEDGCVTPLIPRGSSLPTAADAMFTTVVDNQTNLDVELFQGNSTYPEECVSLGKLAITGIEPRPAGDANLGISISITADNVLSCKARVDGIIKELKLSLAGEAKAVQLTRAQKNVINWKALAKGRKDEAELLKKIEEYAKTEDKSLRAEIVAALS